MSTATQLRTGLSAQAARASYELCPLSADEAARWDELVITHPDFEVFHRQAWLDYLLESRGVEVHKWSVECAGRRVGLFCAGEVRKGPFRILGSPLKGWATNYMGPVLDPDTDPAAFLRALECTARAEGFAMVELEQRSFPAEVLTAAGFEAVAGQTYWVELGSEEQMLRRLHKGRRSGVKKAINSGLYAEFSDDAAVADEFYDFFSRVMKAKGKVPGFPRAHPRLIFEHLHRIDRVMGIRVRDPQGKLLAAGLFAFDNQMLYFWGSADILAGRQFCPNDFLHWSAMCEAVRRGLRCYDMSGYGKFKREFGGELVITHRWHKTYSPAARIARHAYAAWHEQQLRARAWWSRNFSGGGE